MPRSFHRPHAFVSPCVYARVDCATISGRKQNIVMNFGGAHPRHLSKRQIIVAAKTFDRRPNASVGTDLQESAISRKKCYIQRIHLPWRAALTWNQRIGLVKAVHGYPPGSCGLRLPDSTKAMSVAFSWRTGINGHPGEWNQRGAVTFIENHRSKNSLYVNTIFDDFGVAEQCIQDGKNATIPMQRSCRTFTPSRRSRRQASLYQDLIAVGCTSLGIRCGDVDGIHQRKHGPSKVDN